MKCFFYCTMKPLLTLIQKSNLWFENTLLFFFLSPLRFQHFRNSPLLSKFYGPLLFYLNDVKYIFEKISMFLSKIMSFVIIIVNFSHHLSSRRCATDVCTSISHHLRSLLTYQIIVFDDSFDVDSLFQKSGHLQDRDKMAAILFTVSKKRAVLFAV